MNIIFTHLLIKKTVIYTTRINLEKRIFHSRTSILLKIGGPLQLVVVLVYVRFVVTWGVKREDVFDITCYNTSLMISGMIYKFIKIKMTFFDVTYFM